VSECAYPPCSKLWAICRCCYRGHKYCSKACSKLARVEKKRHHNCHDQQGPGRDDHRDRQRALRSRQAKSGSSEKKRDGHTSIEPPSDETLGSARRQEVVLSTEPSARVSESNQDGSPCCRCCGLQSVLVEPLSERKWIVEWLRRRSPRPQPQSSQSEQSSTTRQSFSDYVGAIRDIYAELPITARALPSNELDVARQLHREGVRLRHVEAGLLVATARRVLGNEPQGLEPMCSLRDVVPIIEQARRAGVGQGYVDYLRHKLRHVLETYGAASAKARARARSRASPRR
jgi:hypothetical protein